MPHLLTYSCFVFLLFLVSGQTKEYNDDDQWVNTAQKSNNFLENSLQNIDENKDIAKNQGKSCKCKDNINQAILNSLLDYTDVYDALQQKECGKTLSKKRRRPYNTGSITTCKCSEKVTKLLIETMSHLTTAIDLTKGCKGTIKPVKPPTNTLPKYKSCAEIKRNKPGSPSGNYRINANGKALTVYCVMKRFCRTRKSGWTQITIKNFQKSNCPNGLQKYTVNGVKMCGKKASSGPGCVSITIPTYGIKYSFVCGSVIGYQKGSTDAFSRNRNINSPYLDGISITRGSPRKHVWSLASGYSERASHYAACPCNRPVTRNARAPRFVGFNFYCESGYSSTPKRKFNALDPLWDRKRCLYKERYCCKSPLIPKFRRNLRTKTTDNLELRVCTDEPARQENVAIGSYRFLIV